MPDSLDLAELRRRVARARRSGERAGQSLDEVRAAVWADARAGAFGPVPSGRGWFHEAFSVPEKDAVFADARRGTTITAANLAAATRVYTPGPIVRFLLQNTLGALWQAAHPGDSIRERWPLLIDGTVGTPLRPRSSRELRVCDPCCGAGAMLLPAAHLLADLIQREEGTVGDMAARREALVHAIDHGIWGADIDAEAVAIAREELSEAAGVPVAPHLDVLEPPDGILDPAVWANERFDVVVTNPPYVGTRQMATALTERVTAQEGMPVADLAVAVQRRCWELTADGGRCGTITPAVWLNDRSAAPLRRRLLEEGGPRIVAPLGQGIFDQAPLVFCSLTVLERGAPTPGWKLIQPTSVDDAGLAAAAAHAAVVDAEAVRHLTIPPFAPAVAPTLMRRLAHPPTVGDFFTTFDGAWTGSHRRDVRAWWEVMDDDAWARVSGGQGREGWAAGTTFRMRREHVATQPDRTGMVEYPRVAGGWLCARQVDPGTAARAGVVTFVPEDAAAEERCAELLAIFNTRVGTAWLRTLTSGLNFNPGYAARIPLAPDPPDRRLRTAVAHIIRLRRELARRDPTTDGFAGIPWPWAPDTLRTRIRRAMTRVDRLTAEHLGVSGDEWGAMPPPRPARRTWSPEEDVWMVAALRVAGVRWPTHPDGATWTIPSISIDDLAERVADQARAEGGSAADCAAGATWIRDRFGRYLDKRFRRTAPVTVMNGVTLSSRSTPAS